MVDRSVGERRHVPTCDVDHTSRPVERTIKDTSFVYASVGLLRDFVFPAFKHDIVDSAKQIGALDDAVAMFESFDG